MQSHIEQSDRQEPMINPVKGLEKNVHKESGQCLDNLDERQLSGLLHIDPRKYYVKFLKVTLRKSEITLKKN